MPPRATARAIVGLAGLALLLGACSLVPDYQRPIVATPASWHSDTGPAAAAPGDKWWATFGSDELDRLMATARADNHDLLAAMRRIDEARAQVLTARAPLLPTLDANAGASRTTTPSTGTDNDSYRATLTVGYELDLWGKNRAALAAAQATAQASVYDAASTDLVLQGDVASTYLNILALADRVAVAKSNLAASQDTLQIVETRFDEGAASALDVAQQRQQVASVTATIPALDGQARQDQAALAVLLGMAPGSFNIQGNTLAAIQMPQIAPGLPSTLLERRPDVRKAEEDLIAANANIGVARAAFLPSIELTGSGGIASSALEALVRPDAAFYSLASSLVAPIFEGGALQGQLDFAKARYLELVQTYQQTALTAFRDVEDALAAERSAARQVAALQESVTQARDAHRLADLLYQSGAVDLLTVLDTQRAQLQAEDSLVQAELTQLTAMVDLAKALGGGWQDTQVAGK